MTVIHTLLSLDQQLFLWLNTHWHSTFWDTFFVFLTTKQNWLVPGVILMLLLAVFEKKQAPYLLLTLVLAVILADQLSSGVLKPLVGRLRPCKVLEGFRLLVPCGGRWSFPSAHAANAAAVAVVLAGWYPRWRIAFGVLAFLVGYSRIYVGVHYPLDVLGGWALGIVCGIVVLQGTQWARERFLNTAPKAIEENRER